MNNQERLAYLLELHEKIDERFNEEELRTLVFYVSADWDNLEGRTKYTKIHSLLVGLANSGQLDGLLSLLKRKRPNLEWPIIPPSEQQQEDLHRIMPGNVHQTALEDYQEKIRFLLNEENLRQAELGSPVRVKAQTYTDAVLPRLDKDRRLNVVRFLMQEKLIGESNILHLQGIDLNSTNLKGFDFRGVDLSQACISESYLDQANFTGAKLDHADLRRSSFNKANLSRASLIGARLQKASFIEAILDKADLTGAWLNQTKFVHAQMQESKLNEIESDYSFWDGLNSDFQYAILEKSEIYSSNLARSNFSYANLSEAKMKKCSLLYSNLTKANFSRADLENAYLGDSQLEGANFSQANLTNAELDGVQLNGANFLGAILKGVMLREEQVEQLNPESVDLSEIVIDIVARPEDAYEAARRNTPRDTDVI